MKTMQQEKKISFRGMETMEQFFRYIKETDEKEIFLDSLRHFKVPAETQSLDEMQAEWSRAGWKDSCIQSGEKILENIRELKANIEKYEEAYSLFQEETSRRVFLGVLFGKVTGDKQICREIYTGRYQYFLPEIFTYGANEVFIDGGAFDGESSLDFMSNCPQFKKVYMYEPTHENMEKVIQDFQSLLASGDVVARGNGLSDKKETVFLK